MYILVHIGMKHIAASLTTLVVSMYTYIYIYIIYMYIVYLYACACMYLDTHSYKAV